MPPAIWSATLAGRQREGNIAAQPSGHSARSASSGFTDGALRCTQSSVGGPETGQQSRNPEGRGYTSQRRHIPRVDAERQTSDQTSKRPARHKVAAPESE